MTIAFLLLWAKYVGVVLFVCLCVIVGIALAVTILAGVVFFLTEALGISDDAAKAIVIVGFIVFVGCGIAAWSTIQDQQNAVAAQARPIPAAKPPAEAPAK